MRRFITFLFALGLILGFPAVANADEELDQAIESLGVAPENHDGYDRDLFGEYDRDAILARNKAEFPECDNYYSRYDDKCYESDTAVEIDHRVALAEAWESGAYDWSASQLDAFGTDEDNLAVMTGSLNSSKQSDDAAEYLPEVDTCHYVEAYVSTKVDYSLSVDEVEKEALLNASADCSSSAVSEPSGEGTEEPTTEDSGTLPKTGRNDFNPAPLLIIGSVAVAGGAGVLLLHKRLWLQKALHRRQ